MGVVTPIREDLAGAFCPSRLDGDALRDALARLASGLTLIACWDGATPKGLAATSLIGLSVAPPRLLFSVRHEASAHDALLRAEHFSATVLASEDQAEAERFGRSGAERFNSPDWRLDDPFAPRFLGGLAQFDLRAEHRIGAESHTIFIAEVLDVSTRPGAPLVYFERSFSGLAR